MIKLLLSGICGQMGQVIGNMVNEDPEIELVGGFDINKDSKFDVPIYKDLKECYIDIDVIIDFSNPNAFQPIISFALERKIPIVIATTGLSEDQISLIHETSKKIPIFFASNMSLGINLLLDLVKKATKTLEKNFDIEIIEKHHNKKVDAPSGTAITLADAINDTLSEKYTYCHERKSRREKRNPKEIGIHSVRGGTIVGEHTIIFSGNDEIIELTHKASSKKIFSNGAIKAAKFLFNKTPGYYSMDYIIKK